MTQSEISKGLRLYYPALLMDSVIPPRLLRGVAGIFFFLGILSATALVADLTFFSVLDPYIRPLTGGLLICASLWALCALLLAFRASYYFRDTGGPTERARRESDVSMSFALAEIVFRTSSSDVTAGFFRSRFGVRLLMRLGITPEDARQFFASRASLVAIDALAMTANESATLSSYAKALFKSDGELAQFLFRHEIQKDDFLNAVLWLSNIESKKKRRERWWARENLTRIPALGTAWSYGQTVDLERFAEELTGGTPPTETGVVKEVEAVEAALTNTQGENVLIVAEAGSGELDIVYGLVGMIEAGTAFPQLRDDRIFKLDAVALMDASRGKAFFEHEFTHVMNQAVRAGNIITFFDDLPGFIEGAAALNADAIQLLAPYLASSRAQIIAIAEKGRFHQLIERNPALMNAFEIVHVAEKDSTALVSILENMVPAVERQAGVMFTFPAIQEIAESARRFFMDTAPLQSARGILSEVPAITRQAGRMLVTKQDVRALVESKTGIPQEGTVKTEEKEKLLNLEKLLHERVIGQNEAIEAIANAMRRARAGLRDLDRPIGSFLFLGPTGVGKTETAKALGEVFFSANVPLLRLDMSEYSGGDAVMRLIGSARGHAGVLSSMLRDQKYGVLLLDEFEKTTPEVMNLFLQFLSEGFFSDAEGKKVNARNLIVIATSNAGSEEIFKFTEAGKDLVVVKEAFTDLLVGRGLFKPELLNRFDGIIPFHPLTGENLKHIAELSIEKLAAQLRERGIDLKTTPDLVDYLAEKGYEPKFGARPMTRVLQEKAEKLIADKLIRGEIKHGAIIALVRSTKNPDELEIQVS